MECYSEIYNVVLDNGLIELDNVEYMLEVEQKEPGTFNLAACILSEEIPEDVFKIKFPEPISLKKLKNKLFTHDKELEIIAKDIGDEINLYISLSEDLKQIVVTADVGKKYKDINIGIYDIEKFKKWFELEGDEILQGGDLEIVTPCLYCGIPIDVDEGEIIRESEEEMLVQCGVCGCVNTIIQ